MDLGNQHRIMGSVLIQPKHDRPARCARPRNRQFHPILNRRMFYPTHPPNVTRFNRMTEQDLTGSIDDLNLTGARRLKGRVMRAIFLSFLGHQADIGNRAHGCWVKSPVSLTIFNRFIVNPGITTIRNHGHHIVKLTIRRPHFARLSYGCRHRGIDNNIARDMQVGNASIRIHHGLGSAFG